MCCLVAGSLCSKVDAARIPKKNLQGVLEHPDRPRSTGKSHARNLHFLFCSQARSRQLAQIGGVHRAVGNGRAGAEPLGHSLGTRTATMTGVMAMTAAAVLLALIVGGAQISDLGRRGEGQKNVFWGSPRSRPARKLAVTTDGPRAALGPLSDSLRPTGVSVAFLNLRIGSSA